MLGHCLVPSSAWSWLFSSACGPQHRLNSLLLLRPLLTVCSLVNFLQTAQRNISNPSTINNGTKPTELWLPSNCIQELDANFEGTSVSGILLPAANSTQNVDDCCALCRWEHAHALQTYHRRKQPLQQSC